MAELQQSQFDAEALLSEKTTELEDLRGQLRSALEQLHDERRFRNRFLATLAHELRNPLASLRSGFSLLRRAKNVDDALAAQVNPLIDRQLSHATRLIEEIGDLARARSGELHLRQDVCSLQSAIGIAAGPARLHLAGQEQALHLDPGAQASWISGDKNRIAQVLTNLLLEASRYAPAGASICLAARNCGDHCVAIIADSGEAIPESQFQGFCRPPAPGQDLLRNSATALGIGLSLALHLVESHGGRAWARAHHAGRVFVVELPLHLAQVHGCGA
jgi:signal transduction histidine kinase